MEKNNIGLLLIICGIIMIFISAVISLILGGDSTPYVPSIQSVVILIGVILFFFGLKKSSFEIKENILIILILIGSAILLSIYICNGMLYKTNIIGTILVIVLFISFLISLIYLISQFTNTFSIKDKMQIIGDNSKFFCLGIIVIFIICGAGSNMLQTDLATTIGHVELEEAQVSIFNNGKEYMGHWEQVGTGANLGDVYKQKDPVVDQSIKFNFNDINWEGQVDDAKIKQALKTDYSELPNGCEATITLYDSEGNYINKYTTVPILKGQEVIINNTFAGTNFDVQEMSNTNVKYVEVELILENTNSTENKPDYFLFDIISNRFEIK